MHVMVTGGAGYVGSVVAVRLLESGHHVVVFDDLSRGHRSAVPADAQFVSGDVRDGESLVSALTTTRCTAVVHMAALAEVAESVARPDLYDDVNIGGTQVLADAAAKAGVQRIVFSSTAAVYGAPRTVPIPETDPTAPTNPYGVTKLAGEKELLSVASHSFAATALRYFNACGAYGGRGEDHRPESHLIPLALGAARDGRPLSVFGDDYPTPDGTCIRDYVHVADLADAHVLALERLPDCSGAFNLGTSEGDSVLDVLRAVEDVTGRRLTTRIEGRRPGDPPVLVAANDLARQTLDWRPRRALADAVADAWRWMDAHPEGYPD